MRALVYDRYGGVERLSLTEMPRPQPGPGDVLVEVVATSLNLSDWEGLRGSPAYARIGGLFRPGRPVLGSDIAGRVVAVGPGVERWSPGDEVFGDNLMRKGGLAEYAVVPESALARKPAALSFEVASTIPQSGAIAEQAVALAAPGARMLLNGAGGGSGSFALQLAAAAGIRLTAVDNGGKLDLMRSLGAERVLDYRVDDFTRHGPYDLIVDLVARRSVFAYRRALAPGGRCLIVGGTVRTLLRMLTVGALAGALTGRKLGVMAVRQGPEHFLPLAERVARGEVRAVIDRVCPLAQAPEAFAALGAGQAQGKIVIRVAD